MSTTRHHVELGGPDWRRIQRTLQTVDRALAKGGSAPLMFQSPEFYTNLYTSPENVKRMGVALEAVKIMQNRDRYEAALRREMLTSMILEMHIRENQIGVTKDHKKLAEHIECGQPAVLTKQSDRKSPEPFTQTYP